MRTLSRNTRVELLQVDGIWSLIRDENGEGYVKTAFLRDENSSDLIRRGELSPD